MALHYIHMLHNASLLTLGAPASCVIGLSDTLVHPNYVRLLPIRELLETAVKKHTPCCLNQQKHVKFASLNIQSLTNKIMHLFRTLTFCVSMKLGTGWSDLTDLTQG